MQNNLRRGNVPIHDTVAFSAVVYSGRERLDRDGSALRASLTSSPWVDRDNSNTGTCRLVFDHRPQLSPRGIVNRLGEHRPRQAGDVQILDRDQRVTVNQIAGKLVSKVPSLVGRPGAVPGKVPLRLEPTLARPFASGKGTLKTTLFLGRILGELRRGDRLAVRCGDQARQADIYAHRALVGPRAVQFRHGDLKADVPLAARPGEHGGCDLGISRNVPVPFHLDLTGNADDADALGLADRQPVANAEFGTVPAALGLEARESALALLDPAKEHLERLVEPADNLLFGA